MPQSVLEMAKDLVLAQIQAGRLLPEQVQDAIRQTYASLAALQAQEMAGRTTSALVSETPSVDWRKSITRHAVTCLECGATFKQLSRRHLQEHGLNGRSYRAKYGIPQTQPLAARDTSARRRQVARETRPWERAPMYRRAQERARAEETTAEEPTAARPQQQRKAAPKKAARKQSG